MGSRWHDIYLRCMEHYFQPIICSWLCHKFYWFSLHWRSIISPNDTNCCILLQNQINPPPPPYARCDLISDNAIYDFLRNPHNGHLISRPWVRDEGHLFWFQTFINILPLLLQWCIWCDDTLDQATTSPLVLHTHTLYLFTYVNPSVRTVYDGLYMT